MSVKIGAPGGSDVWNFFIPINSTGYAACKICKKKLSYKTTTSNLKKHLGAVHPTISLAWKQRTCQSQIAASPDDPETVQPGPSNISSVSQPTTSEGNAGHAAITSIISNQPQITSFLSSKRTVPNRKNIDKKLLELFIKDLQPFSMVEDIGFQEFVKALNPHYQLPDRKFISESLIPALYEERKNLCKEKLITATRICITTDTWTSQNTESFIAITAHFINNFKLESILLDCIQISGSHTSENISIHLKSICEEWRILNTVQYAVTDNAINIKNAVINYFPWEHIPCFAHSLNLIVKNSLNISTINELISNIRIIVKYFKKSTIATEKLKTYQVTSGTNVQKLIHDVATRWNSTYKMIDRFILLEEPLKATIAILNKNLPLILNAEWEILHELAVLLKPIDAATKVVSGEKYPTASVLIPLISGLKNICEKLKQKDFSVCVKQVIHNIEEGIADRFYDVENNITMQICTFLDPRFKNAFFIPQKVDRIKTAIINLINDNRNPRAESDINTQMEDAHNKSELSIWDALEENVKRNTPEILPYETKILIEIEQYLREEFYIRNGDPFIWWKNHKFQFPSLKKLMEKLFCIVATSVPCERIFSKAGLILNERRNRLKADKLSMLLFLNSNT